MVYSNSNECLWSGIAHITARYVPETFCYKMKYYFPSLKFCNSCWQRIFMERWKWYIYVVLVKWWHQSTSNVYGCTLCTTCWEEEKEKRNLEFCNHSQNNQENILKRPLELHLAKIVKRQETTTGKSRVSPWILSTEAKSNAKVRTHKYSP